MGEAGNGLRIGDIAFLRIVAEHQVMADQPGDLVGLPLFKAQPFASLARSDLAADFLALFVALAGIVQQHGEIQAFLVLELRHQHAGQRVFVLVATRFDAVDDVDGAQRMLIDRIGMVHVELGLGDDAAEFGDVAAEQAGFRHQAQRLVRVLAAHQDVEEQPGRVRIAAQLRRHQVQVAGDRREGVRMQVELHAVGHLEQLQHGDRRLGEDVRAGDRQATADNREARMVGLVQAHQARLDHLGQAGQGLGFLGFELGAEGAGQRADLLGRHEVAAHEALDIGFAGAIDKAHAPRDFRLQVEAQAFLGPAGGQVQQDSHLPQKVEGAHEDLTLFFRQDGVEHAPLGARNMFVVAGGIFGDPEQGVQVAQAALAFLDIGLDDEARRAGLHVAGVAFLELGGDELIGPGAHAVTAHLVAQALGQVAVAGDKAMLQHRGHDGVVALGIFQRLFDGTRGVADLQAEVPEGIEDELDDRFRVRGFLPGAQEQQVEIGIGGQLAAAIATDGDQGQSFAFGRITGAIDVGQGEVPQRRDDLIGALGQGARGGIAALLMVDIAEDAGARQVPGVLQDGDGASAQVGRLTARLVIGLGQGLTQGGTVDTVPRSGGMGQSQHRGANHRTRFTTII